VLSRKRIGPKTEPCGTPYSTADGVELVAEKRTCILQSTGTKQLVLKYGTNVFGAELSHGHFGLVPNSPNCLGAEVS